MGKVKEISCQNELSTDQRYLYDVCIAVQSGVVNQNLAVNIQEIFIMQDGLLVLIAYCGCMFQLRIQKRILYTWYQTY